MQLKDKGLDGNSTGADRSAAHVRVPAVSVLVPCYNGGQFLDQLMESFDRQTFRDFEIVIVDDGSKDKETLSKLAALEGRARVVYQDNRGPSAARNTAARAALADIVALLDCDDTYEPPFLADTVPLLQAASPDVGMVFTHQQVLGGAETIVSRRYFNRFDILFTNTMSVGLVLRKECYLAVGGQDEAMREGYEDWDFSLRLADAGYRGIEVPKPLYNYHIRPEAMSRSSSVNNKYLHARLWRYIRHKHPDDYRPLAMLRVWRESRDGTGRIPLWKALGACVLAALLPDAYFSRLITGMRNRAPAGSLGDGNRLLFFKKKLTRPS